MNKITQKITGYKVKTSEGDIKDISLEEANKIQPTDRIESLITEEIIPPKVYINEKVHREPILSGRTYKFKPSSSDHAYYVTINNIEIEDRAFPFEIFINSKGMEHFQFLGLARVISGVFRKGGDSMFLAEELKAVIDPRGVYTSSRRYESGKRKRFHSIEAELGDIIEEHMLWIDSLYTTTLANKISLTEAILDSEIETFTVKQDPETKFTISAINYIDEDTLREIQESKIIFDKLTKKEYTIEDAPTAFPPNATMCSKCSYRSVVILDGCATCLQCGDSKCN